MGEGKFLDHACIMAQVLNRPLGEVYSGLDL